jgi:hypothetical protein
LYYLRAFYFIGFNFWRSVWNLPGIIFQCVFVQKETFSRFMIYTFVNPKGQVFTVTGDTFFSARAAAQKKDFIYNGQLFAYSEYKLFKPVKNGRN